MTELKRSRGATAGGKGAEAVAAAPQAYGDLLEYCHGDASTTWGGLRIADGHPQIYNTTWFELGACRPPPVRPDPALCVGCR